MYAGLRPRDHCNAFASDSYWTPLRKISRMGKKDQTAADKVAQEFAEGSAVLSMPVLLTNRGSTWGNHRVKLLHGRQASIGRFFSTVKKPAAAAAGINGKADALQAATVQHVQHFSPSNQDQRQQHGKENSQQQQPLTHSTNSGKGGQQDKQQQIQSGVVQLWPSGCLNTQSNPHSHHQQQKQQDGLEDSLPPAPQQQQQPITCQPRAPLMPVPGMLQQDKQAPPAAVQQVAAAGSIIVQQLPRLQVVVGVPVLACEVPVMTAATPIITCNHKVYGVLQKAAHCWVVYAMTQDGRWRKLRTGEFERAGGRGASKKWKQSCKVQVGERWVEAQEWLQVWEQQQQQQVVVEVVGEQQVVVSV